MSGKNEFGEGVGSILSSTSPNVDSFQSMPPSSPLELESGDGDHSDTEKWLAKVDLPPTARRKRWLRPKVLFPAKDQISSRIQSQTSSVTAPVHAVQRLAPARTKQRPTQCSLMLLSCSIDSAAIANVSNEVSVCSRKRKMSGSADGKESPPPPPPQQEGELAMQAEDMNETMNLQGEVRAIPPWTSYGHFSTVMG